MTDGIVCWDCDPHSLQLKSWLATVSGRSPNLGELASQSSGIPRGFHKGAGVSHADAGWEEGSGTSGVGRKEGKRKPMAASGWCGKLVWKAGAGTV